jgi:hypothetical protein
VLRHILFLAKEEDYYRWLAQAEIGGHRWRYPADCRRIQKEGCLAELLVAFLEWVKGE